jgi:hypothetical protein
MRKFLLTGSFLLLTLLAVGCKPKTEFHGEPLVPGGRDGCEQICSSFGMTLGGMVTMGDSYTNGCICVVPDAPSAAIVVAAAGAAAPAATGVIMQTREDEEEERERQEAEERRQREEDEEEERRERERDHR